MFDAIRFGIFGAIAVIVGRIIYFIIMSAISLIVGTAAIALVLALGYMAG